MKQLQKRAGCLDTKVRLIEIFERQKNLKLINKVVKH